jgi:lipopolysaccharide transport system permease protein
MFFASTVSQGGLSLVNEAALLKKVYFPRLFVPSASAGTALADFSLSFLVYVGMMIWFQHGPGLTALLLPVLLLLTMVAGLGMGYLLAGLTVTYRDFRYVIPFMLQVWMYASPVVYSAAMIPERFRPLMAVNPMYGIIGAFRSSLLNRPIDWTSLGISTVVALGILVLGTYTFSRTERQFADIA